MAGISSERRYYSPSVFFGSFLLGDAKEMNIKPMYIYLTNESALDLDVFFDELTITHTESPILQEDHYYPYGLTMRGLGKQGTNPFKYNGFEEQDELNLGLFDYQARYYDPALGRFINVDPAADLMRRHSPYNYAFDNPIRFTDPDGMMPNEGGKDEEENKESDRYFWSDGYGTYDSRTSSQSVSYNGIGTTDGYGELANGDSYPRIRVVVNEHQTQIIESTGRDEVIRGEDGTELIRINTATFKTVVIDKEGFITNISETVMTTIHSQLQKKPVTSISNRSIDIQYLSENQMIETKNTIISMAFNSLDFKNYTPGSGSLYNFPHGGAMELADQIDHINSNRPLYDSLVKLYVLQYQKKGTAEFLKQRIRRKK